MSRSRRALLALLPVVLSIPAAAQSWAAPARELVQQILLHSQAPSAVMLSVRNLSSLSQNDAVQVRRAVEDELKSRGVRLVGADRAVDEIRITLSENSQSYLWVAQIGHDDSWEAVMTQPAFPATAERAPNGIGIRKTMVWTQADPMLDFATADVAGGGVLLVLQPDGLVLYRQAAGRWVRDGAAPVTHTSRFPRDLRGRLTMRADGSFTANLPGVQCDGSTQSQFSATCNENDNAWPIGANSDATQAIFNPSRNYFTGVLVPGLGKGSKLPPFYSAAALHRAGGTLWFFTLLDGSARLVSADGQNLGEMGGSGSDLAALRSECAVDPLLLMTRAGDSTRPDAVQAYDLSSGQPVETGPSSEFSGPLLSLWTADGVTANAVSRNLKTRQYEAFTLTLACRR